MIDFDPSELFGWLLEATPEVVEYLLEPKEGEPSNHGNREPYPPDGPVRILSSLEKKQAVLKRQSADKEFWETM